MQIHTPSFNVYGVSFPGTRQSLSVLMKILRGELQMLHVMFAITIPLNLKMHPNSSTGSTMNGKIPRPKIEKYVMKDGSIFTDTVAYTIFGPVMYDDHYNGKGSCEE